jgi:ribose 5-phosphate isomerase B
MTSLRKMAAMKTIALGSDHAGYVLKEAVKAHLQAEGYAIRDFGTDSEEPCDYPDFIRPAAESVARGESDCGMVFGGSGNGEAMVANKVRGVRCGLCWNRKSARLTREHNNANVISLGARMVSRQEGLAIVDAYLNAHFQGGRHQRRIDKIEAGQDRLPVTGR